MDGAELAEVEPAANVGGRAAVDGGDLLQRGAPALAARARLAVDLVARAELVLADDPLADVDVGAIGEISRLAASEKAVALARQLEDAEHQAAAATERLIR